MQINTWGQNNIEVGINRDKQEICLYEYKFEIDFIKDNICKVYCNEWNYSLAKCYLIDGYWEVIAGPATRTGKDLYKTIAKALVAII